MSLDKTGKRHFPRPKSDVMREGGPQRWSWSLGQRRPGIQVLTMSLPHTQFWSYLLLEARPSASRCVPKDSSLYRPFCRALGVWGAWGTSSAACRTPTFCLVTRTPSVTRPHSMEWTRFLHEQKWMDTLRVHLASGVTVLKLRSDSAINAPETASCGRCHPSPTSFQSMLQTT